MTNQEDWRLSAQGSLLDFDYREYSDQGSLLDKENGILPGMTFEMGKNQGQWLFSGKLSCHAGDVTYTGQTNGGAPITSVTKQLIADMELRADYSINSDQSMIQNVYFGVARHYWKRDIQPTHTASGNPVLGLLEKYQWWQLSVGAQAMLLSTERSHWLLDVSLMRIVDPQVTVFYSGLYDDVRLSLGERWGARVSLPWTYSLGQSTSLLVEPYMESYRFGHSAIATLSSHGAPIGGVYEPNSTTNNFGLLLGVHKAF